MLLSLCWLEKNYNISALMADVNTAENLAKKIRLDVLKMIHLAGSSHIGSCFSISDILAVLYTKFLRIDSKDPSWDLRDRFFLSKGHAVAALYSLLARLGFFEEKKLESFYQKGSLLLGHANHKIPGIELSTGSLGHALSVATGVALAGKLRAKNFKVVVLLSDGELDEGSNWEAILFASHHCLDNLYAIIDYNKIQSLGRTEDTLSLEPVRGKFEAFNWEVKECNGHDYGDIENKLNSFSEAIPHVLIAHTIKGKGVSFMENAVLWHYRNPQGEEYKMAEEELLNA